MVTPDYSLGEARVLICHSSLNRLLHHAETVLIEGKSFRMKDQIQDL